MKGWVKNYRSISNWEWYKTENMAHLFQHLIREANHEDRKWHGIMVKRGQVITGRSSLSDQTGISEQSVRTCLERLKSTSEITIQSTNRFSVITICNYDSYQSLESDTNQQINQPTHQQSTSNQPAINHKQEEEEYNNLRIEKEVPLENFSLQPEIEDPLNISSSPPDTRPVPPPSSSLISPKAKKKTEPNFIEQIVAQFAMAYEEAREVPYVTMSKGRESAMASKLLIAYKASCPNLDSEKTLTGMRKYFELCVRIEDKWLYDNMSLSLIVNKYNEINTILRNANQRRIPKGGATSSDLERIYRKIDEDSMQRGTV